MKIHVIIIYLMVFVFCGASFAGDLRAWDNDTSAWNTNLNSVDSLGVLDGSVDKKKIIAGSGDNIIFTYQQDETTFQGRNYILRYNGTNVQAWSETSGNWIDDIRQGTPLTGFNDDMEDSRLVADSTGCVTLAGWQKKDGGYGIFAARIADDAVKVWDAQTSLWTIDSYKADPINKGTTPYIVDQMMAADTNGNSYMIYYESGNIWLDRINESGVTIWNNGSWSTTLTGGSALDQGTGNASAAAMVNDSTGNLYILLGYDGGTYLQRYDGGNLKAWDNDSLSWSTTLSDGDSLDRGYGNGKPKWIGVDGNDDVYFLTEEYANTSSNRFYLGRYDGTDVRMWNQNATAWTTNFTNATTLFLEDLSTAPELEEVAADPKGGIYYTVSKYIFPPEGGVIMGHYLMHCDDTGVAVWDSGTTNWIGVFSNAVPAFTSYYSDYGHALSVNEKGSVYIAFQYKDGDTITKNETRLIRYDGTDLRIWDRSVQDWVTDVTNGTTIGVEGRLANRPKIASGHDGAVYTLFEGDTIAEDSWTQPLLVRYTADMPQATITPRKVLKDSFGQIFDYQITTAIGENLSAVDKINISVPAGYTNVSVLSVKTNGVSAVYTDNTVGSEISVVLNSALTANGAVVDVEFEVDTPTNSRGYEAFLSSIDYVAVTNPQTCEPAIGNLESGALSVQVVDAGAALAEISPVNVMLNKNNQNFVYYIMPVMGLALSQVDEINIFVPDGYSGVVVSGVQTGGVSVGYVDNSNGNNISLKLNSPIIIDGTVIEVSFSANTPATPGRDGFSSSINDSAAPNAGDAVSGDGDNGGAVATDSWTVFANGPVATLAEAEIDPVSVAMQSKNEPFSYYIKPIIGLHDGGFDLIEIKLPVGFANASLSSVSVNGISVGYTDLSGDASVKVKLDNRLTANGANIRVDFTADAPSGVDWGQSAESYLNDSEFYNMFSCTSGDGDGGGAVTTDTWTVRTSHTAEGLFTQNSWSAGQFDSSSTNIYSGDETRLFLASDPTNLVLIHEFIGNEGAVTNRGHDRIYDMEVYKDKLYMSMCREPMWSVWGHVYSYDGLTTAWSMTTPNTQGAYMLRTIGDYLWMPSADHFGPDHRRFDGTTWEDFYVDDGGLGSDADDWWHHLDIANYKGRNYVTLHNPDRRVYSFDENDNSQILKTRVDFHDNEEPNTRDISQMIVFHDNLYIAPGGIWKQGAPDLAPVEHYIRMLRYDGTDEVVLKMDRTNAPPSRNMPTKIIAFEIFKDELYFTTWDSVYRYDESTEDATRLIQFPDAWTVHAIKKFDGRLYATVRRDPLLGYPEGKGGPDASLFFNFAGLDRIDNGEVWMSDTNGENWTKLPIVPVDVTYALETWRGRLFVGGGYENYAGHGAKLFGTKIYNSGVLVSRAYDSGSDTALYGQIFFEGETPSATTLRFQFRTASTESGLASATFVGPDGTAATYYTVSGTMISAVHTGQRWFQYAAYLDTSDTTNQSPMLKSVSITFGDGIRIKNHQESNVTSNGATLNGEVELVGSASDTVYICWGDEDGGTVSTGNWDNVEYMGANWIPGSLFSTNVAISAGKIYYYRSYIKSASDEDWANSPEVFTYNKMLPFTETFETNPPVMAGRPGSVNEQHGWMAGAGADVQSEDVWEFDQAVRLSHAKLSHEFEDTKTNIWSVFAMKPVAGGIDVANIPSNATVIFWVNDSETLSAYSNQTVIDTGYSMDTSKWVRIQVQSDYVAKKWSLWADGVNVVSNFGFYSTELAGLSKINFRSYDNSTLYVDDVRVSTDTWNPLPGDSDGDKLPDDWEILYFDSPNISDGAGDYDVDGMSDGGEEIAGTDPTNPDSLFGISGTASPGSSDFVISWSSVAGRLYSLSSSTNLKEGVWDIIETNILATPPENVYTVKLDKAELFFNRLKVRKQ